MAPVALRSFILATVALCSSLSAANPVQQPSAGTPFAVKETYNAPASWKKVGSAPSDAVLDLQVGLMQGKPDELEAELYQSKHRLLRPEILLLRPEM